MRVGYIILDVRQANVLFNKGVLYVVRRLNKMTGVMGMKVGDTRRVADVRIDLVGRIVKLNGGYYVESLDGLKPLQQFLKYTEFDNLNDFIEFYKDKFNTSSIWGFKLYKVELLKIVKKDFVEQVLLH